MYRVVKILKGTEETTTLEDNLTEEQAETICERWGWSYDDGHNSYWLGIEEKG